MGRGSGRRDRNDRYEQIKALERDLGARLFDRDRRPVTLIPAASNLLPQVRDLLAPTNGLERRADASSGSEPARLGYVNWLPLDPITRTSAVAQFHVNAWGATSRAQAALVVDGSLDLAGAGSTCPGPWSGASAKPVRQSWPSSTPSAPRSQTSASMAVRLAAHRRSAPAPTG
ncbi:hypothetical protein AV521_19240 [Streptomyces sp. IMTB 2501]|uniref:LysR family transcriptional regulator n=1 Tax=Streptomyces sp. IMTB 2501 TaxID=1776340 RepID=UPI00096D0C14|nr:LysR family transcriptional regulator [Streptomyces sp. IMTB 2501]OLZ68924.1 hypothetical protein AV521_19240 [Streptomyces sp. IMTB 2501]